MDVMGAKLIKPRYHIGLLFLTLFVSMLLSLLPLSWFQPNWIGICFLYWIVRLPRYCGFGLAFVLGLFYDLLCLCVLGQHALSFVLMRALFFMKQGYFPHASVFQIRFFQMVLLIFDQILVYLLDNLLQSQAAFSQTALSLLSSILVFPVLQWSMGKLCAIGSRKAAFSSH